MYIDVFLQNVCFVPQITTKQRICKVIFLGIFDFLCLHCPAKASLGPYAWEKHCPFYKSSRNCKETYPADCDGDSKILMAKENLVSTPVMTDMEKQNSWVPVGLRDLPRSPEVFSLIHTNPSLSLRLPRCGATEGRILEHAAKVFYDINERSSPMTFKFGITHCPHFRWSNAKFGYKYCVDKFESMVILYAAKDSSGPSFLEASLIREFGSGMAKKTRDNMFRLFVSPWAKKRNTYIAVQVLPYKLLCLGCFMFFKLVYLEWDPTTTLLGHRVLCLRYQGMQKLEDRWWYFTIWRWTLLYLHGV